MASWTGWSPFPLEMRDSDNRKMGEGRPEGLHLGEVVRSMALAARKYKKNENDPEGLLRMQEGFIWEKVVEYMQGGMTMDDAITLAFKRYMTALNEGLVTQISIRKDGIWMTPDGFDPARGEIVSYKHTRYSLRKAETLADFMDNFWTWFVAEKGYCIAASCDTVRFVVLWVAGDYSKGIGGGPQALQCSVTFTPEELFENWKAVLAHAEGLR